MADVLINKDAESMNVSPPFEGYSKVIVHTGETDNEGNEIVYSAGNTSGRTLRVENPWANQATAEGILTRVRGWAYQPFEAEKAMITPASEIGDSIAINGTFSGIYKKTQHFMQLCNADIAAPHDEEIDHEYTYESEEEREFVRRLNEMRSTLSLYTGMIEAKVDKISDQTQSFGWRLTENGWTVFNQSGTIFSVSAAGASVAGEIKAQSGKIGGFNIGPRGLWNNQSSFNGQEQTGVYIGTDGIQLGTKFKVDAQGNLTAASGRFNGSVFAENIKSTPSDGEGGYFPGSGIDPGSLGTTQFASGVNYSLGYADFANEVFNNRDTAEYIKAKYINATRSITADDYYVRIDAETQGTVGRHTHYVSVSGNQVTIGAPDFTGANHPFEKSGTVTVQSVALNGTPTYQTAYNRYAVPVKVTLSTGAVTPTTLYVNASDAYNAGKNSVDVSWSDGDYDIWIHPYYYDSWEEVCGGLLHAKLTNGKERTRRLNQWDA